MRSRIRCLSMCFFISLLHISTLSVAQENSSMSIRERLDWENLRDCKPAVMTRCWYLFFGEGEHPNRKVYVADLKTHKDDADTNLVAVDVIVINESESSRAAIGNDFVFYTIQYQCGNAKMRELDAYAFEFTGKLERATMPTQWYSDYQQSWYGIAGKIACEDDVRLRPDTYNMVWVGSLFRPIDVVDIMRKYVWKQ